MTSISQPGRRPGTSGTGPSTGAGGARSAGPAGEPASGRPDSSGSAPEKPDRFVAAAPPPPGSSSDQPAAALSLRTRRRAAGSAAGTDAEKWIQEKWDTLVAAGVKEAKRLDVAELASEQILQQIDKLAAGDPMYTPAARNLLKDTLRRSPELQLADRMVGDAAQALGDDLSSGGRSSSTGPGGPRGAGDDGWQVKPILQPVPKLTLDPDKRFLDSVGMKGGVEARQGDLKLRGELMGSLDAPLTSRDRAEVGARFGVQKGPVSGSLQSRVGIAQPLGPPRLDRVDTELKLDYAGQGVFRPGDRLSVSGQAKTTQIFGPAGGLQVGAGIGATYMARGVLHPKDALSVSAKASFLNQDLGGKQKPSYNVGASLAYHF